MFWRVSVGADPIIALHYTGHFNIGGLIYANRTIFLCRSKKKDYLQYMRNRARRGEVWEVR